MRGEEIECAAQQRARSVHRVGEVDDLYAELPESSFELVPSFRAAPVISLEDDIEPDTLPCFDFVEQRFNDDFIDETDAVDDLQSLGERYDGWPSFQPQHHLVGGDAGDEVVAVSASEAENIEMSHVEQVVYPGRESDAFSSHDFLPFLSQSAALTVTCPEWGEVFSPSVTLIEYRWRAFAATESV